MMKTFLESMKKFRVLWIFALATLVLFFWGNEDYQSRQSLVYNESLSEVVAEVDGKELSLRDLAIYVAFQEEETQRQAIAYDCENPRRYWNTKLPSGFVKFVARDRAVNMMIHDEIFAQKAKELNIILSEEELLLLENDVEDFWLDLVDRDGQKKLGITRETIYDSYYKITCSQKAQKICAAMEGLDYGDYDIEKEEYLVFLEKHTVKIEKDVVGRLDFGNITLEY